MTARWHKTLNKTLFAEPCSYLEAAFNNAKYVY